MKGVSFEALIYPQVFLRKVEKLEREVGEKKGIFFFLDDVWHKVGALIIVPEVEAKVRDDNPYLERLPFYHSSFTSPTDNSYWEIKDMKIRDDEGRGSVSFFEGKERNDTVREGEERIKVRGVLKDLYLMLLFSERGRTPLMGVRKVGENEEGRWEYIPEELVEGVSENEGENLAVKEKGEEIANFDKLVEVIEELLEEGYFNDEGKEFIFIKESGSIGSYDAEEVGEDYRGEQYLVIEPRDIGYRIEDRDRNYFSGYIAEGYNHSPPEESFVWEEEIKSQPKEPTELFFSPKKIRGILYNFVGKEGFVRVEEEEFTVKELKSLLKKVVERSKGGRPLSIINLLVQTKGRGFLEIDPEYMDGEDLKKVVARYANKELTGVERRSIEEIRELVADIKVGKARRPIDVYQKEKFNEDKGFSKFVSLIEENIKKKKILRERSEKEREERSNYLREEGRSDRGNNEGITNIERNEERKKIEREKGKKEYKYRRKRLVKHEIISFDFNNKRNSDKGKLVIESKSHRGSKDNKKGEERNSVVVEEVKREEESGRKRVPLFKVIEEMMEVGVNEFIEVRELVGEGRGENLVREKADFSQGKGEGEGYDTVKINDTDREKKTIEIEDKLVRLEDKREGLIRGPPQEESDVDFSSFISCQNILPMRSKNIPNWEEGIERGALVFYLSSIMGINFAYLVSEFSLWARKGSISFNGIGESVKRYGFNIFIFRGY